MAEEFKDKAERVLRPRIAGLKFKERERALYGAAESIPNWKLADKSRRILADVNAHLSAELPARPPDSRIEDLAPSLLRQAAAVSTAAITVRAVGSGMSLIACGYMAEAASPLRRAQEARLNAMAIRDDPEGAYAARYLQGRATGLSKLAQKYKVKDDVDTLSTLTHADVRGLRVLGFESSSERPGSIPINVRPKRDEQLSGFALYLLAYEAIQIGGVLATIFEVDVELPSWVVGELNRVADELQKDIDAAAK